VRAPRLSLRLSVYVTREVALHAAVGLAALSLVFVGRNLLRYAAELLAAGASPADLVRVLRCIGLASLAYTLPIAFLFGVLAGVARLAEDREAFALRSCGLGLRQVGAPVLALGLAVSALSALLVLDVEPRAKRELRGALASLAGSAPLLEAGRFTELGARTLWVGERRGSRVERVFAADRSRPGRPVWVFAERGEIAADPESGALRLTLYDGDLQVDGPTRRARIAFESFALPLPGGEAADAAARRWRLRPKDLGSGELLRRLAGPAPTAYRVQLERRLALPLAPLLLGAAALPLALRRRRGARAWGLFACTGLVLAYHALLACGQHLALEGWLPAWLALWSPNAALAGVGALLLLRARHG
jgi:lipopolysaccharide export system permease protein